MVHPARQWAIPGLLWLVSLTAACASTSPPHPANNGPRRPDVPQVGPYTEIACGTRVLRIGGTVVTEQPGGKPSPLAAFTISVTSAGTIHSEHLESQVYSSDSRGSDFSITVNQSVDVTYHYDDGVQVSSLRDAEEVTLIFRAPGCVDLRESISTDITGKTFVLSCPSPSEPRVTSP